MLSSLFIILGLAFFETINSLDNVVINAEVLATLKEKSKKWFLSWGLIFSVFLVRGIVPLLIVWIANPSQGIMGIITSSTTGDPRTTAAIALIAPSILIGGGVFLVLLFLHWFFEESRKYGLKAQTSIHRHDPYFAISSLIFLVLIVFLAAQHSMNMVAASIFGATVFFLTNYLKTKAEQSEEELLHSTRSDIQKLIYLEVIDATFSLDGVLGAFAFTFSIPLILIGNGIGALIVRQLTLGNIKRIQKYAYLKTAAMYSIFILGTIMILDSFGLEIPSAISPATTVIVTTYFFLKARNSNKE